MPGRPHVGLQSDDAEGANSLHPPTVDILASMSSSEPLTDEGTLVKAFADQHGLSASNARVRIFRARAALKKRLIESCGTCAEHGCRDCACQTHG